MCRHGVRVSVRLCELLGEAAACRLSRGISITFYVLASDTSESSALDLQCAVSTSPPRTRTRARKVFAHFRLLEIEGLLASSSYWHA